jgi:hypothetical protein
VAVDFSISDRSFFETYFRSGSVDRSKAKQEKQSEREYLKNKTLGGDGRHGSIIPSPGRVRSRNDMGAYYGQPVKESSRCVR